MICYLIPFLFIFYVKIDLKDISNNFRKEYNNMILDFFTYIILEKGQKFSFRYSMTSWIMNMFIKAYCLVNISNLKKILLWTSESKEVHSTLAKVDDNK